MGYRATEEVTGLSIRRCCFCLCCSAATQPTIRCACVVATAPQVTLPARFLTTTAHFVAVLTILFDVVRQSGGLGALPGPSSHARRLLWSQLLAGTGADDVCCLACCGATWPACLQRTLASQVLLAQGSDTSSTDLYRAADLEALVQR